MNDRIEAARKVALDILKPSEKDLEHGLALHAASVVCDAYSSKQIVLSGTFGSSTDPPNPVIL